MISKISKGSGFAGAEKYIEGKKGAELIYSRNLLTKNHAVEMRCVAESAHTSKPVLHVSLSAEPGERGTNEQWQNAAEIYLKKMGFDLDKTQFKITRHTDTKIDHIHILANRVQLDGRLLSDSKDRYRSHEATRFAEKAAGFKEFNPHQNLTEKGKIADLRQCVNNSLSESNGDYAKFKDSLKADGISIIENRQSTGRVSGLSFQKDGEKLHKASTLGKDYSAGGLQKRGLEINQNITKSPETSSHNATNGLKNSIIPASGSGSGGMADSPKKDDGDRVGEFLKQIQKASKENNSEKSQNERER
jgi:Relaxase/Mobilisation nuclease domain